MGNTSSHSSPGQSGPTSPTTQPPSTAPSTSQPVPTTSQHLPNPSAAFPHAFHSGLTPPARTPSPPPPSTPLLMPHAGHLTPQNPHALSLPQIHDYSKNAVTRLILDEKLAPFYRGLEDWEEDWGEDDVERILEEVKEKDYEEGVGNSVTERLKEEREGAQGAMGKRINVYRGKASEAKLQEDKDERERREKKAYLDAIECPICFLNYPPNINTSRCCQQPICTECFVQIKRSEPTITHLESEPACCPFCVETDFGVIYERPSALGPATPSSESALATSPEAPTSDLAKAMDMKSEVGELNLGIGMPPKVQETMRRKSVSSKSKEVVTIDEIRPDWERKLNAVKAAAARRASRRIIMRQVGDRLIPIGYTSSRAPGTADFSMSIPPAEGEGTSRRSRRRDGNRDTQLEELMIMEAMRLSLLDHEEHQRRLVDQQRPPSTVKPTQNISGTSTPTQNPGESSRRVISTSHNPTKSGASKIFSKFSGNRSRANSSVSFAPMPARPTSISPANSTNTNINNPDSNSQTPSPVVQPRTPPTSLPSPSQPVAPVTTLANHDSPPAPMSTHGLPRLSMDMPALVPDSTARPVIPVHNEAQAVDINNSEGNARAGVSTEDDRDDGEDDEYDESVVESVPERLTYARLDSGEE
ncbi:hypothetical protein M231_04366 [Tremella mesenterica]|uniref:RING-type domain-containing protein n=1 Tax=Tremella mesenterica TaxID=5217 RepID=A0A4Q1BKN9_TREME|nr:hypothetical protein M231_04366 [Tremella mesenterica]